MLLIDKLSGTGKKIILLCIDGVFVVVSLGVAIWLQYPGMPLSHQIWVYLPVLPIVVFGKLFVFYLFRLYRFLWRYASLNEAFSVIKASLVGSLILSSVAHVLSLYQFGVRLIITDAVITILFIGGFRLVLKSLREYLVHKKRRRSLVNQSKTLIIGAGDAGEMVARELIKKHIPIVGFVDDHPQKIGITIHDIPVLGDTNCIPEIVRRYDVDAAIVAIPSANGETIRRFMNICQSVKVSFKTTPNLLDIVFKKESVGSVRNVRIEDLLGRESIFSDLTLFSGYIDGTTVLITGAGGSIGSELCRQLALFSPKKIVLFDQSETALFDVDADIYTINQTLEKIAIVGDIKHFDRLKKVFEAHRPDIIFHAAAYKHVPLMESHPHEAFENNVLGTQNVMTLAHLFKSREFVLISTDKAVRPTNCMGATKRICEIFMQHYAMMRDNVTTFTAVRFGNVLGSQGSVIPIFKKQIEMGGPITITHPEMTRYFMTIPEAVRLVIQAGALSRGGEIFILDMGEPVKIVTLAKDLVALSGFTLDKDIHMVFTGLRPGEKLYEELSFDPELLSKTAHPQIFVTHDVPEGLSSFISELQALSYLDLSPSDLRDLLVSIANRSCPSVS